MSITSAKSGATGISLALDNNFMEPIATTLVGAGGVNTVIFNDIPQTYKHLQIRAIARDTAAITDNNMYFTINGDASSNYNYHFLYGSGTAAASGGGSTVSNLLGLRITGGNSTAGMFGAGIIDILDYTNTNKNKTVKVLTGNDQNGSGFLFYNSGLWMSTAAITSLTFVPAISNFAQNTRISLYGIKG